jgi:hypothetical protein
MDDLFLCPDCHAEHGEPLAPSLGHRVRCLSCEMMDGTVFVAVQIEPIREPLHIEIHIAA